MPRPLRSRRLKLFLQVIPLIVLTIAAIAGASQLKVVKEFLAGASGEPANLMIDTKVTYGPVEKPWQNLAQGGEMSNWTMDPILTKTKALAPQYIRIDHIYSFYDVVKKDGDKLVFDFSKLDVVVDGITSTGAKPYIALSYMPAPLAEDGQITSKPAKWEDWQELVRATIQHYSGDKKISDVVYEVWNEPDLFGGWKPYGDKNYLTLYSYAARGQAQVKNARPYKFGGPAITALYKNWFTGLVEYTQNNNLRLDFFSWHRYNLDVEQFRKDFSQATEWRSQYPTQSSLELHITEAGHDSNVHPGYDTSYGAAHTAAISLEAVGNIDRLFLFEVEDGKDPKGQERWGRWGMLTHRDFGNNIKPRYLAVRLLNRISGERVQVLGKGTWVKAVATKNGPIVEMLVANYDQYASHVENVPVTYKNLAPGSYTLEITDSGGSSRKVPLTTETNEVTTQLSMAVNSLVFTRLIPDEATAAKISASQPAPEATPALEASPEPVVPQDGGSPLIIEEATPRAEDPTTSPTPTTPSNPFLNSPTTP